MTHRLARRVRLATLGAAVGILVVLYAILLLNPSTAPAPNAPRDTVAPPVPIPHPVYEPLA